MSQPAKVLAAHDVRRLSARARGRRPVNRNVVIILLSFKAGLRACEIAGLEWPMVSTADGRISRSIQVSSGIAKNGKARRIPMHPDLRVAMSRLHVEQGFPGHGPIVLSLQGGHMRPRSIVNWFAGLYGELNLSGCSSHSGRRTFITKAAKLVARAGGSLRDVQELAGHRALTTTERYIEGDREAQRKLVRLL